MAMRYGADRKQAMFFPERLDDYVPEDDPVRVYDEFVNQLDFVELGINEDPKRVGNSPYDPRAMMKLLVYGYSYGVFSSRKLERAVHHNVSFMWLVGGLKPDHKTIAEFRRKNMDVLREVFFQCVCVCLKLNMVDGNILFLDSTKIWANAAKEQSHYRKWYENQLKLVDDRIAALLEKCEAVDREEAGRESMVKISKELVGEQHLKATIQAALKESDKRGEKTKNGRSRKVNRVDPESTIAKGRRGEAPSFSVQSVVDDKKGLIVSVDAVSDANDLNQLSNQIEKAEEILDVKCKAACADAGYYNIEELNKIQNIHRNAIVPSQEQASRKEKKPFCKSAFKYDKDNDCYYCPEGHRLKPVRHSVKKRRRREYRIEDPSLCRNCRQFRVCTSSKNGRNVVRHVLEDKKNLIAKNYAHPQGQKIYRRRKMRVEHPFGYIKKSMDFRQFNLRGRKGANAEFSMLAIGYNIKRMITIEGGAERLRMKMAAI